MARPSASGRTYRGAVPVKDGRQDEDSVDPRLEEMYEERPPYAPASSVDWTQLRRALSDLNLLGDDPFLRMQAFNLAMIDEWLTGLEQGLLEALVREDGTPLPEAAFLSAQSQMWLFAAYELMRTWRQRCRDMIKWSESGGLERKLSELERDLGYLHFAREVRASQIRSAIENPERKEAIAQDLKRTYFLYAQLEAVRVSLAKHEVRRKKNAVAVQPGYGRINRWCGALDYDVGNGVYSVGPINRRDIADGIRALVERHVPSDEDLASFDAYMRGAIEGK